MASKWGLKEKLGKMEGFKKTFPVVAGNKAVNHFLKSFRDQGFTDQGVVKWKPRKNKDSGRAILVKTGALRRSIRRGFTSWSRTVIESVGVKYAPFHNEGTSKLPKRQFMGRSRKLENEIKTDMDKKVGAIMK